MITIHVGRATLAVEDFSTEGLARIYLTDPQSWQGEFHGDARAIHRLFGEVVTLTLEGGATGSVLVGGTASPAPLRGSGPWPFYPTEARV